MVALSIVTLHDTNKNTRSITGAGYSLIFSSYFSNKLEGLIFKAFANGNTV
jgi:hypothetical protein